MGRFLLAVFLFITSQSSFAQERFNFCVEALNCCKDISQCNFKYKPDLASFKLFLEGLSTDIFLKAGVDLSTADLNSQKTCLLTTIASSIPNPIYNSFNHLISCKEANKTMLPCPKALTQERKIVSHTVHLGSQSFKSVACSETTPTSVIRNYR